MPSQILIKGHTGDQVAKLKAALARELGAQAASSYPGLAVGDTFDTDTEAALRAWQSGMGLVADSIAGPHCRQLLGLLAGVEMEIKPELAALRALFPDTKPSNIARYLPYVTDALEAFNLVDRPMILAAFGTIRAETAGFVPISEYASKYNTDPGKPPFSRYEPGTAIGRKLGNEHAGDGALYCGRGFVQLTGAYNYRTYSQQLWEDDILLGHPEFANAPEVAAVLLARFLSNCATKMRAALEAGDFRKARALVNGGSHGLPEFQAVFEAAEKVWPSTAPAGAAGAAAGAAQPAQVRRRGTRKDPPDLRDREFQPLIKDLVGEYPPQADVQGFFAAYEPMVLDQGEDSSCTGYALACVVNFARWRKQQYAGKLESVSARMLYNYARRYDEYEGEDYEGSSCRGALKGWYNHGVCLASEWPDHERPKFGFAERALQNTLGVYYRINLRSVTDLQAAIMQGGAIYVSAFTHDGWLKVPKQPKGAGVPTHETLPAIPFDGRPSKTDGHAFAMVGFNRRGFVIQNSWGLDFGFGGFAVLTYEDWLANSMDAWVASLGVPGVVQGRIASSAGGAKALAGAAVDKTRWWDQGTAYEHSVVFGNDGRVDRYLAPDELTRSLVYQACTMPDQWFRTQGQAQPKKRLVIYAHGGLNSEADAIERAQAMGRFFIGNGCYPLFLVWKTGLLECVADAVEDAFRQAPQAVGGVRERLLDATDTIIEKTLGRGTGRPVWDQMKQNAQLSCAPRRGGFYFGEALEKLSQTWGDALEIHLVGHSAGSIMLGHLLEELGRRNLDTRIAGAHLFAPACTVQFANRYWANDQVLRNLWLHVLADEQERNDNVAGIYRKSLLYMVSNALETDQRTPLLGLHNIDDAGYTAWDGSSTTVDALARWRYAAREVRLARRTNVVASARITTSVAAGGSNTEAASHGSFDNNVDVITKTLQRITGMTELAMPVDDLRGY